MAITISRFNHTAKKMLNSEIALNDLAFMLLGVSAAFDATHTSINQVAGANTPPRANEVSGNGWTTGGENLASVAITAVATSGAMIDAADITKTATGGSIGPAYAGVIYEETSGDVLWYIDFDGAQEAGVGTDFKITFHANGIARVTNPA
jgi:hypothetical protein